MLKKTISFLLCFSLLFMQSGIAGTIGELNVGGYLSQMRSTFAIDKFRPLHLRYFSYDTLNNNFRILLDKGDIKEASSAALVKPSRELLNYFLIGVTLTDDAFWVNLRPDSEDSIIDPQLARTDVGKILLEADLQLKKDTARFTSPETPEGRAYWNKLYQKAQEIFGSENVTIPTLTRPWIVPDEVIIRQTNDSAYIYKATLKVMLEQDHLKNSATYNFKDDRLKQLNEYSSQIIRETIIPKLTKEVNISKRYAALRQVYYSLILARWFKVRFNGRPGEYSSLINIGKLDGLTSKESWAKSTYFKAYKESFEKGEYNVQEQVLGSSGKVIRSYFSGGIAWEVIGNSGFQSPNPGVADKLVSSGRVVGFDGNVSSPILNPVTPKASDDELQLDEPGKGPGGGPIIERANSAVREANILLKSKGQASLIRARKLLTDAIEGNEEGLIGYNQIMESFPAGSEMYKAAEKNKKAAQALLEKAGGSMGGFTVLEDFDEDWGNLPNAILPNGASISGVGGKYMERGAEGYKFSSINIRKAAKGKNAGMHYLIVSTAVWKEDTILFAIPLGKGTENLIPAMEAARQFEDKYVSNTGKDAAVQAVLKALVDAVQKQKERDAQGTESIRNNFVAIPVSESRLERAKLPKDSGPDDAVVNYYLDKDYGYEIGSLRIMKDKGNNGMYYLVLTHSQGYLFGIPLGTNPGLAPVLSLIRKYSSGDSDKFISQAQGEKAVAGALIKALESEMNDYYSLDLDEPGQGPGGGPIIEGANNLVREANNIIKTKNGVEPNSEAIRLLNEAIEGNEDGLIGYRQIIESFEPGSAMRKAAERNMRVAQILIEQIKGVAQDFLVVDSLDEDIRSLAPVTLPNGGVLKYTRGRYKERGAREDESVSFDIRKATKGQNEGENYLVVYTHTPQEYNMLFAVALGKGTENLIPALEVLREFSGKLVSGSGKDQAVKAVLKALNEAVLRQKQRDLEGTVSIRRNFIALPIDKESVELAGSGKTYSVGVTYREGLYQDATIQIVREKAGDRMYYLALRDYSGDYIFGIPLGTNPSLSPVLNIISSYQSKGASERVISIEHGDIAAANVLIRQLLKAIQNYYYSLDLDEPGRGPGGGPIIEGANRKVQEAAELLNEGAQAPKGVGLGGIDFRTMNIMVQPMGSFSGLSFKLPKLANPDLVNVDKEFGEIRNMVDKGLVPSGERIKELIAACVDKQEIGERSDDMIICLADIFRLEEETLTESSPELRESLVILDSNKFTI